MRRPHVPETCSIDYIHYRDMLGYGDDAADIARLLKVHGGLVSAGLEVLNEDEPRCEVCHRLNAKRARGGICAACRDQGHYATTKRKPRAIKPEPKPKPLRSHDYERLRLGAHRLLKAIARIQPKAPPAPADAEPPVKPRPVIWIRIPLDQIK